MSGWQGGEATGLGLLQVDSQRPGLTSNTRFIFTRFSRLISISAADSPILPLLFQARPIEASCGEATDGGAATDQRRRPKRAAAISGRSQRTIEPLREAGEPL